MWMVCSSLQQLVFQVHLEDLLMEDGLVHALQMMHDRWLHSGQVFDQTLAELFAQHEDVVALKLAHKVLHLDGRLLTLAEEEEETPFRSTLDFVTARR